jgi:hypothetical protein
MGKKNKARLGLGFWHHHLLRRRQWQRRELLDLAGKLMSSRRRGRERGVIEVLPVLRRWPVVRLRDAALFALSRSRRNGEKARSRYYYKSYILGELWSESDADYLLCEVGLSFSDWFF